MKKAFITISTAILFIATALPAGTPVDHINTGVTAVKGRVYDLNHDGSYDYALFGIMNFDSSDHFRVNKVEIYDLQGRLLKVIHNFWQVSFETTSWYVADVRGIPSVSDFIMKIFIKTKKGKGSTGVMSMVQPGDGSNGSDDPPGDGPGDPNETILVLKYP